MIGLGQGVMGSHLFVLCKDMDMEIDICLYVYLFALAAPVGAWLMTKLMIFIFSLVLFEYMLDGLKVTLLAFSAIFEKPRWEMSLRERPLLA